MRVAIGLGANLGHPEENIQAARDALAAGGMAEITLSPLYKTTPVDCVPGTPDFVNAALVGDWPGDVDSLLETCKAIEEKLGRPRIHSSEEARMIDLDILMADGAVSAHDRLTIPHPRFHERLFALVPLNDLAPDWVIPGLDKTVAEVTRDRLAADGDSFQARKLA
ncbi:MAG: 2-amino-4-hydroxy-6-hydroxymethyldihydropteridine diphosphokinase [Lentisphaeria bacterium]|nr:2-amino-4-hydroxy-6-hydroxymethyldihydropteridine diphosphokinase [Lentisphaeria bacterium]